MKKMGIIAAVALLAIAATGCKQAPKYALTDGQWVLISWQDDADQEIVVTANRPTMTFDTAGTVTGFAGCNDFSGRYEQSGEKITVDMGAMTMKMCLDMESEDRMAKQMPLVTAFEIDGNQLILFNADGQELFRFDNTAAEAQQ
ncbi:MAG: META domain-containing protein [Rikenellaceae bacterium]|jgi:heat shock protein HslJ|nr:META domain-containing protein [Rikenellaceae bacterium]